MQDSVTDFRGMNCSLDSMAATASTEAEKTQPNNGEITQEEN